MRIKSVLKAGACAALVINLVAITACKSHRNSTSANPSQSGLTANSLPPLDSIPDTQGGNFDRINATAIPADNSEQNPFHVPRSKNNAVQGWMITPDGQSVMDPVIVIYPGGRLNAKSDTRPDVAAHFNNQKLLSSGFRFDLKPNTLPLGLQTVDVVGMSGGQYYRFAKTLYLYVE